jgi:hypothetical protein
LPYLARLLSQALLVLIGAGTTLLGGGAAHRAVRTRGAQGVVAQSTGAQRAVVTCLALERGEDRAALRAVIASCTRRAVRHINEADSGRVGARRTKDRGSAAFRAVVTRGTDIVDRRVETLNACLADVADLEPGLAALMRGSDRAATAAEVALAALGGGFGEASRPTVVARCALRALADIREAEAVAVCAIGTQELGGEAGPFRAVAAWRALRRRGGIVETE